MLIRHKWSEGVGSNKHGEAWGGGGVTGWRVVLVGVGLNEYGEARGVVVGVIVVVVGVGIR